MNVSLESYTGHVHFETAALEDLDHARRKRIARLLCHPVQGGDADHVRVAAPCSAGWENMVGTERVRFCGQCNLNVYNLSAMSKSDAERLVVETEGRLCIRYYQREDGTILTKNCPVGLRALKRRLSRVAGAAISAVFSFLAGVLAVTGWQVKSPLTNAAKGEAHRVIEMPRESPVVMGNIAPREPTLGHVVVGTMEPIPATRRKPHLYE